MISRHTKYKREDGHVLDTPCLEEKEDCSRKGRLVELDSMLLWNACYCGIERYTAFFFF